MSYLSPLSISHQEAISNPNIFFKSNSSLKLQYLNHRPSFSKDQKIKKSIFPELPSYEKKMFSRRRSISKAKIFQSFKAVENDNELKIPNAVVCTGKNFSITLPSQKYKKINFPKESLKYLIKPEFPKSPSNEIKIEITKCDNIEQIGLNFKISNENQLGMPSVSPEPKINSHNNSRRNLSPVIKRSYSQCEIVETNEDPYFLVNINKFSKFTPFSELVEAELDKSCTNFPYFLKTCKNFCRANSSNKQIRDEKIEKIENCDCFTMKIFGKNSNKVAKIKNLKLLRFENTGEILPSLICVYKFSHTPIFEKNLIILNFEGVLGNYVNEICIKPGILQTIKNINDYIQIVLVVNTANEKTVKILDFFESLQIKLSRVYLRQEKNYQGKEMNKLQDYSLIFKDFEIENPEESALIIASHRYVDQISDKNQDIIAKKIGISIKLNVERVPAPSAEFAKPPFTILLPYFQINKTSKVLQKLLSKIESCGENLSKLNFSKIFTTSKFSIISSNAIHMLLLENIQFDKEKYLKTMKKSTLNIQFCGLHQKFTYKKTYSLIDNKFVIN